VAIQRHMFSSEGKAEMPGVGCIIRSMSSFWRLWGVRYHRRKQDRKLDIYRCDTVVFTFPRLFDAILCVLCRFVLNVQSALVDRVWW
jgi:hypothetical protein